MGVAATKEPTASWVDIAVRGNKKPGPDGGEKENEAEEQSAQACRGGEWQAEFWEAIQADNKHSTKVALEQAKDRKGAVGRK